MHPVARRRALVLRAGRLRLQPHARAGLPRAGPDLLHAEDRLVHHLQQRDVHRGLQVPGARGGRRERRPGARQGGRLREEGAGGLVDEHRRARAAHRGDPLQPLPVSQPAGDTRHRRAHGVHDQGKRRDPAAEAPLRVQHLRLRLLQAAAGVARRPADAQPPHRHAHRAPHGLQGDAAGLVRAAPERAPRADLRGDHLRHQGDDRVHGQQGEGAGVLPGHRPAHRQPREHGDEGTELRRDGRGAPGPLADHPADARRGHAGGRGAAEDPGPGAPAPRLEPGGRHRRRRPRGARGRHGDAVHGVPLRHAPGQEGRGECHHRAEGAQLLRAVPDLHTPGQGLPGRHAEGHPNRLPGLEHSPLLGPRHPRLRLVLLGGQRAQDRRLRLPAALRARRQAHPAREKRHVQDPAGLQ
mmetsp:Transcript_51473/g.145074  ORF Transcript_51473/g.145074 Transcript_51473/m.145074 type:complete len:411 (-) Transcript_51473:929-2161(-)